MTLNGTGATHDRLDPIIDRFYEGCLRASVADSLDRGWREQLIAVFRAKPEGTAVSATPVTYGQEEGWFSLIRENGVYRADFWTPELCRTNNQARPAIDTIAKELSAVMAPAHIHIRGIKPHEWLARKGLRLQSAHRVRR